MGGGVPAATKEEAQHLGNLSPSSGYSGRRQEQREKGEGEKRTGQGNKRAIETTEGERKEGKRENQDKKARE